MLIVIAATPILFHVTGAYAALGILNSNRFELKPSEGTDAELMLGKPSYYLSTTRSKLGAYTVKRNLESSVILCLDGNKLASRYKIKPVDYWGTNELSVEQRTSNDEAEDRVLVGNPFMPALPFIREVHAFETPIVQKIKRICLLRKIPLFVYSSTKDMLLLDKRKAIRVKLTREGLKPEPEGYKHSAEYLRAKYAKRRQNSLSGWIELWHKPIPEGSDQDSTYKIGKSLKENGQYCLRQLSSAYNGDAERSLSADMHNAKSTAYAELSGERESLDKLVLILRKNGLTLKAFIDKLYTKWFPRKT